MAALGKSLAHFIQTAEAYPRVLVQVKPSEAAFSATEVVYHMLDVERLWQGRMRGLLYGTMTQFQQMDPDKEAREGGYNKKNYEAGIRELNDARGETYALVQAMTPDELLLAGIHPRYGEMDTFAILQKIEEHDRTHTSQLERTLRQIRP